MKITSIFEYLLKKILSCKHFLLRAEAATEGILQKVFLKISQIPQENTCVGVSFKLTCRTICEFLRTPVLKNICERLIVTLHNGILEKWDPGSGTHAWDLRPGTLHLGPGTHTCIQFR